MVTWKGERNRPDGTSHAHVALDVSIKNVVGACKMCEIDYKWALKDMKYGDKIKCVKCGLEFVPVKYRALQQRVKELEDELKTKEK